MSAATESTSQLIVPERSRVRQEAVSPSDATTPMQMLAIAVQQGADIDKLKQLMDLQERWEANLARKAFDAAISAAKAEIKPIAKNREVDFTGNTGKRTHYFHEDFAGIAEAIDPVLAKHGLSYRHRSQQEGKRLKVTCVLSHRDGHSEETSLVADNDESGNKNSIQSIGSAATYLQRYTLKLALGLSAAKDDDGRDTDKDCETITEKQSADLLALITELGGNQAKLLQYWKVENLSRIRATNFDTCCKEVRAFAAAKQRAAERLK